MQRRVFLQTLLTIPLAGAVMKLKELNDMISSLDSTALMPVLFIGHGSPMNAIEDTGFSRGWTAIGKQMPRPEVILCISAHWETKGTFVTAMEKPETIHDFGGFPQELFNVRYPAPGSPATAKEVKRIIRKTEVGMDEKWGLDHGCWSVVRRMYPAADIPVIQLSLDFTQPAAYHYDLAKELAPLRKKGVLIIGSGNMVHNLRRIDWSKTAYTPYGYDWAIEASEKMKKFILSGDHQSLINYRSQGSAFDMAIPTPEHYLPLLYALALKVEQDTVGIFNDQSVMGSLTMTSLTIQKS